MPEHQGEKMIAGEKKDNLGGHENNREKLDRDIADITEKLRALDKGHPRGKEAIAKAVHEMAEEYKIPPNKILSWIRQSMEGEGKPIETPKNYNEYVTMFPDLGEYFGKFKIRLLTSMKEAEGKAQGTVIEGYFERLSVDFDGQFENIIFKLLSLSECQKNPQMIERIINNTKIPIIQIGNLGEKLGGKTFVTPSNQATIIISTDKTNLNESYQNFKLTFVHELVHAYVGDPDQNYSYVRNKPLNEGITQLISENILDLKENPTSYKDETRIANELFKLDKDATLDWYTGGENEIFKQKLIRALSKTRGKNAANEISEKVVALGLGLEKLDVKRSVYEKNVNNELIKIVLDKLRQPISGEEAMGKAVRIVKLYNETGKYLGGEDDRSLIENWLSDQAGNATKALVDKMEIAKVEFEKANPRPQTESEYYGEIINNLRVSHN